MNKLEMFTLSLLFALPVQARTSSVKASPRTPAYQIVSEDEADVLMARARFIPARPALPIRDEVIGDTLRAGDSYWDYQSNGTVGKMIALDSEGGVHVTWTDGYDNGNNTRHQKYNFYENGEWVLGADGTQGPAGTRSGYGSIWLSNEEHQRALIFTHATGILAELAAFTLVDFDRGWGAFESFALPRWADNPAIWPQGVLSPENRIHVVCNKSNASILTYTTTNFNEGAPRFPDVPIAIDTMSLNTYRIARSPHSERAAITWIKSRVGIPAPAEWDGFLAWQMNNDLWVAWTDNGVDWNFNNPLNVTNCIPPDPERFNEGDTLSSYGDTLRPFVTHDVIFDANDYMHIVFEARGLWEKAVYDPAVDRPPVWGLTIDMSYLYIWSEETGDITPVADGWYTQQVRDENDSLILWPKPGAWKSNVCNPSLAYDANGQLYCVFNNYPYGDYNDYVGGGRCHGDVSVTQSNDNGETWYYPTKVVLTTTPLAEAGQAMSEEYPTVAENADDALHIFYEVDRESGTVIQGADDGSSNTLNPMMYLRVPIESLSHDSIFIAPDFHTNYASVGREPVFTPAGFRLTDAFPNPFNNQTRIGFDLQREQVIDLAVYDLDGRKVQNLYSGTALSGHHESSFNADGLSAGIYLIRLEGGGSAAVIKVALVR